MYSLWASCCYCCPGTHLPDPTVPFAPATLTWEYLRLRMFIWTSWGKGCILWAWLMLGSCVSAIFRVENLLMLLSCAELSSEPSLVLLLVGGLSEPFARFFILWVLGVTVMCVAILKAALGWFDCWWARCKWSVSTNSLLSTRRLCVSNSSSTISFEPY